MSQIIRMLIWLAAIGFLAGCSAGSDADQPRIRLLLWHTWTGEQIAALDEMIATYQELNPHVEVIDVAVPVETIVDRVANRSAAGLGPDLILSNAPVIYQLAESALIRDLAPLGLDLSNYLSNAVRMVSDDAHLYALPLSAHTHVLYYNKELVEAAPATIAELMQRAEAGEVLAQNPNFVQSYWGVGAYDGRFVDGEGNLLLGEGGFTNWLDFLSSARTLPGFLLNDDPLILQQAFVDGEATYYVADSDQLSTLAAAMGPERLGVGLLPSGPNGGVPSPLLELDALAFGNVSNQDEFDQALDFAQYLGGSRNQLFVATADLGRVPVNTQIRLTPSLPANTLTVARQSRSAESVSLGSQAIWADLRAGALGFLDSYRRVSQGVLTPHDMVQQALTNFSDEYSLSPFVAGVVDYCPSQPGVVTLWHSLPASQSQPFDQLVADFEAACQGVEVDVVYVPERLIFERVSEATAAGAGPDLLYTSSRWLAPLAEAALLADLTERVKPDFLQQFIPSTVESMRYAGRLYGIPESVNVQALVYDADQVVDPPIDFQQLVQSVNADRRLALPVGFSLGYWGLSPFGGFDYDSYTGAISKTEGLLAWLSLLQTIDVEPGVDLYLDYPSAEEAFVSGEAAYLVSEPQALP
ncbi:MAG: extracellular solute-binding protein, partial [Caldilineaceae bacterium]|nr:extracellular solute-binding protein [Caldilineaceae bacterium]